MHIDVILNNAEVFFNRKFKKKNKDSDQGQKMGLQAFLFRSIKQETYLVVPHPSVLVHELN